MMHHRIVAKLMGFITPEVALQRFAEADRSVPARYARAIAWYRKGALGSALLGIDGLLKEYPNDPYFHEVRGQMLFENGRVAELVLLHAAPFSFCQVRRSSRSTLRVPCSRPTIPKTTARPCAIWNWQGSRNPAASTFGG